MNERNSRFRPCNKTYLKMRNGERYLERKDLKRLRKPSFRFLACKAACNYLHWIKVFIRIQCTDRQHIMPFCFYFQLSLFQSLPSLGHPLGRCPLCWIIFGTLWPSFGIARDDFQITLWMVLLPRPQGNKRNLRRCFLMWNFIWADAPKKAAHTRRIVEEWKDRLMN